MPRITATLGFVAVSALLCGTALAATPDAKSSASAMSQSLDTGIRDAQVKRSQGDYAASIHILSQLMLVSPDDPRVVSEYGKVLVQQGRAREALDFLNRAAQLSQGDWTVFSALGVAYDQTGDYASARKVYEHALALKPGETVILNNFAMSRAQAGDLTMAKKLIAEASASSSDERIARNVSMINSLTPKVATAVPAIAPTAKTATVTPATAMPRALTAAEGNRVLSQPIPADPKAGPIGKARLKKVTATASALKPSVPAKPSAKKPSADGIPSLRLANDRQ